MPGVGDLGCSPEQRDVLWPENAEQGRSHPKPGGCGRGSLCAPLLVPPLQVFLEPSPLLIHFFFLICSFSPQFSPHLSSSSLLSPHLSVCLPFQLPSFFHSFQPPPSIPSCSHRTLSLGPCLFQAQGHKFSIFQGTQMLEKAGECQWGQGGACRLPWHGRGGHRDEGEGHREVEIPPLQPRQEKRVPRGRLWPVGF